MSLSLREVSNKACEVLMSWCDCVLLRIRPGRGQTLVPHLWSVYGPLVLPTRLISLLMDSTKKGMTLFLSTFSADVLVQAVKKKSSHRSSTI